MALLIFLMTVMTPIQATAERGTPPLVTAPTVTPAARKGPPVPATAVPVPPGMTVGPMAATPSAPATLPPVPRITPRSSRTMEVLGDSISSPGYGGQWAWDVAGAMGWARINQTDRWGLPNAAIPGSTLEDFPAALPFFPAVDFFAQRYKPTDELFIYLGTNDWGNVSATVNPITWMMAWDRLYSQIEALPHRPQVYVIGLESAWFDDYHDRAVLGPNAPLVTPGWASWASSRQEALDEWNAVTRQAAARHGATYISLAGMDVATMFDLYPDGIRSIHPNARGQAFISGRVLAALGGWNG